MLSVNYSQALDNRELGRKLELIAIAAYKDGQALGLTFSADDVAQELVMAIIEEPNLKLYPVNKAGSILRGKANSYINSQKNQVGGFQTSPEHLVKALEKWSKTGELPYDVSDALYGVKFALAGSPPGSYRLAVQEAYQQGLMPVAGSAQAKKLRRAIRRLAEIISGVMVGSTQSLDEQFGDDWHPAEAELTEEQIEDSTFNSFSAKYICSSGHVTAVETAVEPPKKLGLPRVYGQRFCACGGEMSLSN